MSRIAHDSMYALGETGLIAQVGDSRSDAVSARRSFIGYQPARFTGCTKRNKPTDSGSVAELSASIAHQLSQPLTSMLANAQAAKRWLVAGPQNLMEAIASIDRIVRDARTASETMQRIRAREYLRPGESARSEKEPLTEVLRDAWGKRGVLRSSFCYLEAMFPWILIRNKRDNMSIDTFQ